MEFGQKLQVGFVVLMLALSGFFFLRNSSAPPDMTITSFTEPPRGVPIDPARPLSAKNPVDPTKSYTVTVFANFDGRLEIVEHASETSLPPDIRFKPDFRRLQYQTYQDPMKQVDAITDPYKQTISRAAYSVALYHRALGLLGNADLDSAQLKSEKDLRQTMTDEVALIDESAKTGSFESDLYQKVFAALAEYRALEGDPTKDPAKAEAARKVMSLSLQYLNKVQKAKKESIDNYIVGIDNLLTSDQKAKLSELGQQYANRRPGRRPAKS